MNRSRLLLAMLAFSLWLCPAAAQTPPGSLPSDLVGADPLSEDQEQRVEAYAEAWGGRLLEGDDQQVADARKRLLGPLQAANASPAFRDELSLNLFDVMRDALASERVIVRLNAVMVLAELSGTTAAQLMGTALGDSSPAVRYWAAQGIEPLAATLEQGPRARNALGLLHQRVKAAAETEPLPVVFGPLLNNLAKIGLPEAVMDALRLMNQRVDVHAKDPTRNLANEVRTLKEIFQRVQVQDNVPEGDEPYRWIALVCYRYLRLSAEVLAMDWYDDPNSAVRSSYIEMAREADERLRFAVSKRLASEAELPPQINALIGAGQWNMIRDQVNTAWVLQLTRDPIGFSPQQLTVTVLPPE